ncbi:MAG: hypothetical protein VYD20_03100 [Candidatus Neomarinimicrobiota bacterium]|nr:hypothetical protein [Candidatus Neomarinimicrobiota bacterium]
MNRLFTLLSILVLIITMSCEDNEANEGENLAESGSIYGKVTFSGTWPDTGSVLLTLNTTYPPQGPPAGFEYLSLETILNNEYEYSFNNLSFTNYEAVSVTHWPDDYPNGTYTTLGGHFEDMTVTQDNSQIEINFNADF